MRRALPIVGSVVVVCLLILVVLRIEGLDPRERRPGLWLRGETVGTVSDWSFTDRYPTIYIQTRTWYLLPHSVTITCAAYKGQLFLTAVFRQGSPFPGGKQWVSDVMRDPHARLKIGDKLYDVTLALVTDAEERKAVLDAKAQKYPTARTAPTSTTYLFRVLPG